MMYGVVTLGSVLFCKVMINTFFWVVFCMVVSGMVSLGKVLLKHLFNCGEVGSGGVS